MKPSPHLEESMEEEQIREAPNKHWRASADRDANAEHDIYADDDICDYFADPFEAPVWRS
jgi:hypothetical protein